MTGAVNIEINKSKDFRQVYSIGAMGGHSPYDFRIAFYNDSLKRFGEGRDLQTVDRLIETEVILSPAAAKGLANWLMSHVKDYENMFGNISSPEEAARRPPKSEPSSEIQGYM